MVIASCFEICSRIVQEHFQNTTQHIFPSRSHSACQIDGAYREVARDHALLKTQERATVQLPQTAVVDQQVEAVKERMAQTTDDLAHTTAGAVATARVAVVVTVQQVHEARRL